MTFRPAYMHAMAVMKPGMHKEFISGLTTVYKKRGLKKDFLHRDRFHGGGIEIRVVDNTGHGSSTLPRRDISFYVPRGSPKAKEFADALVEETREYFGRFGHALLDSGIDEGPAYGKV